MGATGQTPGRSNLAGGASRPSPERASSGDGEKGDVHPALGVSDPPAALIDRIPPVVLPIDAGGNVVYCNGAARRHLGAGSESPVGLPVRVLAPELVGEAWPVFVATLRATGKLTGETRLRSVDGRAVPVEVTVELMAVGGTEQFALFAVVQGRDDGTIRQQRFAEFSIEHLSDPAYFIGR